MKIGNLRLLFLIILGVMVFTIPANNVWAQVGEEGEETGNKYGDGSVNRDEIIKVIDEKKIKQKAAEKKEKEIEQKIRDRLKAGGASEGKVLGRGFGNWVRSIGSDKANYEKAAGKWVDNAGKDYSEEYLKQLKNLKKAQEKVPPNEKDIAKYEEKVLKAEQQLKAVQDVRPMLVDYLNTFYVKYGYEKELKDLEKALSHGDVYYYLEECDEGDGICKKYFVVINDKEVSVSGVTKGCIPLAAKQRRAAECFYCPLFTTIFQAIQTMADLSFNKLAEPLQNVVALALGIFIAMKVFGHVTSMTKQDAPKFLTEILLQTFNVVLAFLLLQNSMYIYDLIISPVLEAGLQFGGAFLEASGDEEVQKACATAALSGGSGPLSDDLERQLNCFIITVQRELANAQAIAASLMCVARNEGKVDLMGLDNVMWDVGMMMQGFIIYIFAWLIALAFAFYLIDATVRIGIVGALMPFLIACWPFKITRTYSTKGWTMIMNTFFVYVFIGLVVRINIELMGHALTGSEDDGGFDAVVRAINGNNVQVLKQLLDIGVAGFLILIACCLFGFKLTGQATELATNMAGGGGGENIGAKIGGLAVNTARKLADGGEKLGKGLARPVTDTVGRGARQAKDWTKAKVGKFVGKTWVGNKLGIGKYSGKAGMQGLKSEGAATDSKKKPDNLDPKTKDQVDNIQENSKEKELRDQFKSTDFYKQKSGEANKFKDAAQKDKQQKQIHNARATDFGNQSKKMNADALKENDPAKKAQMQKQAQELQKKSQEERKLALKSDASRKQNMKKYNGINKELKQKENEYVKNRMPKKDKK